MEQHDVNKIKIKKETSNREFDNLIFSNKYALCHVLIARDWAFYVLSLLIGSNR